MTDEVWIVAYLPGVRYTMRGYRHERMRELVIQTLCKSYMETGLRAERLEMTARDLGLLQEELTAIYGFSGEVEKTFVYGPYGPVEVRCHEALRHRT